MKPMSLEEMEEKMEEKWEQAKAHYKKISDEQSDRRSPYTESRRRTDCFPNGSAIAIGIGIALVSLLAAALGFALGKWVF